MANSRKCKRKYRLDKNASARVKIPAPHLIIFVICCVMLFLASWFLESLSDLLCRHTAKMAASLLGFCGSQPVLDGATLRQGGFRVVIISECTALYMWILFASFVIAYSTSLRRKMIGLFLGTPVIHVGNILRIAVVFAIGVKNQRLFEFVHVYLGQIIMFLFVMVICLAWAQWARGNLQKGKLTAYVIRFIAFSSIPFLFWLVFNREYVMQTDHLVRWFFALVSIRLTIPYQHAVYYQTFNLVTFAGLILASRIRMNWRNFWLISAGIISFVGMHVLIRICNVLVTAFRNETAASLSSLVFIVGEYFLPMLLWLLLVRGDSMMEKEVVSPP